MLLTSGRGAKRRVAWPPPRPLAIAQLPALIALWRSCGLGSTGEDPATTIPLLLANGHGTVLVAEQAGRVIAAIVVGHDGRRGWIDQLAVASAQRRHGLGRAMVAAAEAWLKARQILQVSAPIRPADNSVVPFLAALGYDHQPDRLLSRRLDGVQPFGTGDIEVTITALRMDSRPVGGHVPTPPGRPVLMRLENPTVSFYRHLYNEVGRQWLWYERRRLTDEALGALITDPGTHLYVPYLGGVPAGFFELDARRSGLVQLTYFGLSPAFIGRRIGPWMLDHAIQIAWSLGPARLWVHTCTLDHPKALPMYKRGGFTVFDRRTERIPDPLPWML